MGHTNSNLVNLVSSALATIGQQVGELRNEIGLTSHGKSLEEIKQRNNNVDLLTQFYIITGADFFTHRFQQGFGIFQRVAKIYFNMGFNAVNIGIKLRPSPIFLDNGF
jgi:hypothetical protein